MLFISLPRGQPERLSRKETEKTKENIIINQCFERIRRL